MWITQSSRLKNPQTNPASARAFNYQKKVFFKDTNLFGTVYFAQYFLWQGEAREEFLFTFVPEIKALLQQGLKIITLSSTMEFKKEVFCFDELTISIRITSVGYSFMKLEFTFKRQEETVALGTQKIVFADQQGRPQRIPELIIQRAQEHGFISQKGEEPMSEWNSTQTPLSDKLITWIKDKLEGKTHGNLSLYIRDSKVESIAYSSYCDEPASERDKA